MILTNNIQKKFQDIRSLSPEICNILNDDNLLHTQSAPNVSPPVWHLGHQTWFFETVILKKNPQYREFHPDFSYYFNSYYESLGDRLDRSQRTLNEVSLQEILNYRSYVDRHMMDFLEKKELGLEDIQHITLGIAHEEQHIELLLMDIKHILSQQDSDKHRFSDSYYLSPTIESNKTWLSIPGGNYTIGADKSVFCFDNEQPQHLIYLQDYLISSQVVTNREYLEFIMSGGYSNHTYWHMDGFEWVKKYNITSPLYWEHINGTWYEYTFQGLQPIIMNAPANHITYYEAHAYAEWKNCRLPTESEWEIAAQLNKELFTWGQVWEWTRSAYLPYPGYQKYCGPLGEYNAKFMVNQMVLKGASFITPEDHSRTTYRNFFYPVGQSLDGSQPTWQFSGIRLAKDTRYTD